MHKNRFLPLITLFVVIALALAPLAVASAAPQSFVADQASCKALAEKNGNVAKPNDPQWVACFVAGWVNWIVGTEPTNMTLPEEPPQAVKDALKRGVFVQLTEPWNGGCDNSLAHPDCSIGYLKLFSDWRTLRAFLAHGEFTQAGIVKNGPWSIFSLWMTNGYVQVAEGDKMSADDEALVCSGAMGLVFAYDGDYPLPSTLCDGSSNEYALMEAWNGGCIGTVSSDVNCNVGEIKLFTDYKKLLDYRESGKWNRGSVWVNREDLNASARIVGSAPTQPAAPTATKVVVPTATPTRVSNSGLALTAVASLTPGAPTSGAPIVAPTIVGQGADSLNVVEPDDALAEVPAGKGVPFWCWGPLAVLALIGAFFGIRAMRRRNRPMPRPIVPPATGTAGHTIATPVVTTEPTLTRMSHDSIVHGATRLPISLEGTNFAAGALVIWADEQGNQLAELTPVITNDQRMSVVIPRAQLATSGMFALAVKNPNGEISDGIPFEVL